MATSTFTDPRSLLKIDRLLSLLSNAPMSKQELAVAGAVSPSGATMYMRHLMSNPKRVYIIRWERRNGRSAPVYAVGDLPNAREPKRLSRKAYRAKAKAVRKADPDKMAEYLSKRAIQSKLERVRKKPNTWLSVLM